MKKFLILFFSIFISLFAFNNVYADYNISLTNHNNWWTIEKANSFKNFIDSYYSNSSKRYIIYQKSFSSTNHQLLVCDFDNTSFTYPSSLNYSFQCNDIKYINYDSENNVFNNTSDGSSYEYLKLFTTNLYIWSNFDLKFNDDYFTGLNGSYLDFDYLLSSSYDFPYSINLNNKDSNYLLFNYDMVIPSYMDLYYPDVFNKMFRYTIEYYFDNKLDSSKTINSIGNINDSIDYDKYSSDSYLIADDYNFKLTSNNLTFNVYYNTNIKYKINYYFDGILDSSKTFNGTGKLNSKINDYDKYSSDDYIINDTYNFVLTDNSNEFNVYYTSIKYTSYTIEYYFDGILDSSKTEVIKGVVGDEVLSFKDYSSDFYNLSEDHNYSLILDEDSNLNILKIFYYSSLYGTEHQPIDTSESWFYLFFNFDDIKNMFKSINFNNFTQFQQLVITIGFNILFLLLLIFILYLAIKMLYKVLQFIF